MIPLFILALLLAAISLYFAYRIHWYLYERWKRKHADDRYSVSYPDDPEHKYIGKVRPKTGSKSEI